MVVVHKFNQFSKKIKIMLIVYPKRKSTSNVELRDHVRSNFDGSLKKKRRDVSLIPICDSFCIISSTFHKCVKIQLHFWKNLKCIY